MSETAWALLTGFSSILKNHSNDSGTNGIFQSFFEMKNI